MLQQCERWHLAMLACARSSPVALPRSATANDVCLQREGYVERARAKIVTSGTFFDASFLPMSEMRSIVGKLGALQNVPSLTILGASSFQSSRARGPKIVRGGTLRLRSAEMRALRPEAPCGRASSSAVALLGGAFGEARIAARSAYRARDWREDRTTRWQNDALLYRKRPRTA